MNIKVTAAVCACKFTQWALRILGRGGTTLPGKLALRLCPDLLTHLAKGVKCVVITGTNGKTTSARMVEEMFKQAALSYFANRSGSNLTRGVATEFASNCTLTGKPRKQYAVIEADEAASKEICKQIDPALILVTNIFRDQLDRYGEVTHTLNNVLVGIQNSPHAQVLLNADCSLSVSMRERIPNKIVFYGVDVPVYRHEVSEVSDAPYCIHCKHEYEYTYRTFGHLGGFFCPNCGYRRPERQVAVTEILSGGIDRTTFRAQVFGDRDDYTVNLPGGYNIYNAVGAIALGSVMGFDKAVIKNSLNTFSCGFGRMEQFDMGGAKARMVLVKNPAGCNQVLSYFTSLSETAVFVCCLNDRLADGTDVSWIYDVNFELLCEMGDNLNAIYVSGVRCYDMAVRLKYAGVPDEKLRVFEDYDTLINAMRSQSLPVVIMPTYTAMMDLREKMSAAFGGKDFWE